MIFSYLILTNDSPTAVSNRDHSTMLSVDFLLKIKLEVAMELIPLLSEL